MMGSPVLALSRSILWGIDPLDPSPAIRWFDEKADQIREEERSLSVAAGGATLSTYG
jgi:hypothetical protein